MRIDRSSSLNGVRKALREDRKTQRELSRILGLSRKTIYNIIKVDSERVVEMGGKYGDVNQLRIRQQGGSVVFCYGVEGTFWGPVRPGTFINEAARSDNLGPHNP